MFAVAGGRREFPLLSYFSPDLFHLQFHFIELLPQHTRQITEYTDQSLAVRFGKMGCVVD
jgi:hypothetical protein